MMLHFNQQIMTPLSWGRGIALLLQVLYLFWLQQLPSSVVWVILSVQTVILLHTLVISRATVSQLGIFIALLLDALLLIAYVYLTGGIANPLISLLLLPVATASLMLKPRYALSLLLIAIAGYSLLLSLVSEHQTHHSFTSHLIGMWLVFIASALLLYYLVSRLVRATRNQQLKLEHQKQRQLRDDYLLALGVSAADAAHQLNTPLSSMAVMIDDMPESDDKSLMEQQISRCQKITQNIQQQFEQLKLRQYQTISVHDLLSQIAASFRLLHPEVRLELDTKSHSESACNSNQYQLNSHLGFISALLNIMDNAAKASQLNHKAHIKLASEISNNNSHKSYLTLRIFDFGEGLAEHQLESYGFVPNLNSRQGMGTGSLISSASIELLEGAIQISNHEQGALVTVSLPVRKQNAATVEG
ncbi:MAG TPA: ATP-binding protein [Kangiella sp.]